MKISTKIKIAAVSIAIVSTVAAAFAGYRAVRGVLCISLEERVRALAATIAAQVDSGALASLAANPQANTAEYQQLQSMIQLVTRANEHGEFPVRFVYLLVPTKAGASSGWDFAVDSVSVGSPDWTSPGTPYNPIPSASKPLEKIGTQATALYINDQWGEWLSGYAPVHASGADGQVVGMVGVDIPFVMLLDRVDLYFWLALALCGLCSVGVYFATDRTVDHLMVPITRMRQFVADMGEGHFERRLENEWRGEVRAVADELNEMARKLTDRERLAGENRGLHDEVSWQNEKLMAIAQVDVQLNEIKDIDILMQRILADARKLLGCDAGSVMLREGDDLLLTYAQNDTLSKEAGATRTFSAPPMRIPVGGGSISGYAAVSGKAVVVEDAYAISENSPFHFNRKVDEATGYRTRSVLALPLGTSAGKNVGVLQLLNPVDASGAPRRGFSPDDLDTIHHFAAAATVALERAQLTRALVLRMIAMVELRDPSETAQHASRVAEYSVILYEAWAKRHGVESTRLQGQRDALRTAAMLHDVGKVGISDAILKKPGRLTVDEYRQIQEHTIIGARLFVGGESVLDEAMLQVALHHHERWDGAGYPGAVDITTKQGMPSGPEHSEVPAMKGEAIPLFARIVAVADVFDALSSKRQYKDPWPEERVIAEMQAHSGKQFEPELIEILMESLDEFRAVAARYP